MTLFTYLDERFRTLSLELQTEYTIAKEAELKAAYSLIQGQRTFFKWLKMPVLISRYLLINLGWKKGSELPDASKTTPEESVSPKKQPEHEIRTVN